jgi:L-ascorbate metabolism protein UlaG (beta-lactamase superfamily)
MPRGKKNFVTDILIPSLFERKKGQSAEAPPILPQLEKGQIGLTWIGHATFLVQTDRHNILIDPNWAPWLSVIRRLRHAGMELHHLPNIDAVLVTHAHFDHLNRPTLKQIAEEQPIAVPEGVGDLVHDLGFEKVHEMKWWDSWDLGGLKITFVPASHWGARVLVDQHRGYGGFYLSYAGRTVYHSGDTAFFSGFKEIADRMPAADVALLPIGAYETPSGRDNHMSPEEALEAFEILGAKLMVPMHFGTYRMTFEPMEEPPQRLLKATAEKGLLNRVRFLVEGQPQVF